MDQGGDTYQEGARQVDEQRRGVLQTLPYPRHPVRPESEQRTAIRQTVPAKAPVEAETSTIINKSSFFFKEFHFELASSCVVWIAEVHHIVVLSAVQHTPRSARRRRHTAGVG